MVVERRTAIEILIFHFPPTFNYAQAVLTPAHNSSSIILHSADKTHEIVNNCPYMRSAVRETRRSSDLSTDFILDLCRYFQLPSSVITRTRLAVGALPA